VLLSFFKFGILRSYDLILCHLHFRTLYSRWRLLDALFLINVFKGKINCHSIMDTVGIRVPTRKIREFPTFSVNSALRHSPSARCVIAANVMHISRHFWQKLFLPWGHLLVTWRCLDWLNVLSLFCFHFCVVFCTLYMFYILSSCADSAIGSCSCWVSTLK
jgi:hypothetical protein